jgi:hypothetical protein
VSAAPRDPLAVGLGALGAGIGLGGALITLTLLAVRVLQRFELRRYDETVADAPLAGLAAAITLAAAVGWRRSRALENLFQRGVIAALAAVGAILVAFLAIPAWHFLGFGGLVLLAAGAAGLGAAASRWAAAGSGPA